MRVRFEEGVYADFYNLHADAGYVFSIYKDGNVNANAVCSSEDEDVEARSANLQQVADYIANNSLGNAVLVFGDTNARYTSSGENVRVFETQEDMTNPWVELVLDGKQPEEGIDAIICENPSTVKTCETVDKILYFPFPFPSCLCWILDSDGQ